MEYKVKLSKEVETYLMSLHNDLDKGNNSQIYEAFDKACEKILQNPTSPEFLKNSLGEYRGVDVLAQTRAFFKIYGDVIFVVWVNPEEIPHDSSKGEFDPCYRHFKNLFDSGKLEIYIPVPHVEPEFIFKGKFRRDARFFTGLKTQNSFSQAILVLKSRSESEYELDQISEDHYNSDSLPLLLERVVAEAKKEKINLISIVGSERDLDYRDSVTKALRYAGFDLTDHNSEGETYYIAA